MNRCIDSMFDGLLLETSRFVEVENDHGHSIDCGAEIKRADGY